MVNKDDCPNGCGKLKNADGKLECVKCGWWVYN